MTFFEYAISEGEGTLVEHHVADDEQFDSVLWALKSGQDLVCESISLQEYHEFGLARA